MNKRWKMIMFIAGAIFISGMLTNMGSVLAATDDEHIYKGIFVEDVDLSGLSKNEAKTKLDQYAKELGELSVTFYTDQYEAKVKLGDIDFAHGENKVIEEAMSYGKVGNVLKRYKDKKDIEHNPIELKLDKTFDSKKLTKELNKNKTKYVSPAVNASLTRVGGDFQITPEKVGQKLDTKKIEKEFKKYLQDNWTGEEFRFELATKEEAPAYTKEDLYKVTNKLGSYSTKFATSSSGRAANISNGTKLINGTLLYPGEEFSTYEAVAPFTPERGYFMAGSYANGEVVDSIGGGICQVSTTLYNAVLRAELEITERAPHSMNVAYVPLAWDAAIAGTFKNFKFKNNTDAPIYIEGVSANRNLIFTIYGEDKRAANRKIEFRSRTLATYQPGKPIETKDPTMEEGKQIVTQSAHVGYKAECWKDVYIDGKVVESILINTTTYQASPQRVTVGSKEKEEDKEDKDKEDKDKEDKEKDKNDQDKKPVKEPEKEPVKEPGKDQGLKPEQPPVEKPVDPKPVDPEPVDPKPEQEETTGETAKEE